MQRATVGAFLSALALAGVACGGGMTVTADGCPRTIGATSVVDYAPFVKVDDRTYMRVFVQPDEEQLEDADLGDPVEETTCELADVVNDPDYRAQNGDAAFLEPGTTLFAVDGFQPGFRLAAQVDGELQLYEVNTLPGVDRGADILSDLVGKVRAINVNSEEDGETVLGRITDEARVQELVGMVLDAPVDEKARPDGTDRRYFLEFELDDTPPVKMVLFRDDGILHQGIQVPDEFIAAMNRAASSR